MKGYKFKLFLAQIRAKKIHSDLMTSDEHYPTQSALRSEGVGVHRLDKKFTKISPGWAISQNSTQSGIFKACKSKLEQQKNKQNHTFRPPLKRHKPRKFRKICPTLSLKKPI